MKNRSILFASIGVALLLCGAQVVGSSMMVLGSLVLYMMLLVWCCWHDYTFPVLLFFLPWSPIMRLSPSSFSIYTIGLVLICLISIFKNHFSFRGYQIKAGLMIMVLSLVSKLLDGSSLTFDYVAFLMMIIIFPTVMQEYNKQQYDFLHGVVFLSLGIIIAALCAMYFEEYANICKFVRVDSYLTIVRRSGFYSDPNFYVAQILAALSGVLALILQEKKGKKLVFLGIVALFLIYCGFLSGSKSFVLTFALILLLWVGAIIKMRGRFGAKVVLLAFLTCTVIFIATSTIFSDLIVVIMTRFSYTSNMDSFTTGRTQLWQNYISEILSNMKVFFLGKGFTNIIVNGRASHNTIIQIFYQFGILGVPVIAYWIMCFFKEMRNVNNQRTRFNITLFMVGIGAFLPWLAIDALFFDEFFLFQMYMCLAINRFGQASLSTKETSYGQTKNRCKTNL